MNAAQQTLRAAKLDAFPTSILEVCLLRARIYLRLAGDGQEAERWLGLCERDLDRLERTGRDDARAHASLLRASVAMARGQHPSALALLSSARAGFAGRQMALGLAYVAAAEDALGALLEGSLTAELMPKVVDAVSPYMPDGVKERWDDVLEEIRRRVSTPDAG